ncbi:MAG: phosphodiesterase [Burkholderiaceae bacterium]
MNAAHADASFVVITGDLTHWGEPQAYEALQAELARLVVPVELMIGNHDDRAAFGARFPTARRDRNGFVQGTRDLAGARLVFLDTVLAGTHAGAYCPQRLEWLAATLGEAPGSIVLFSHHPPFEIGIRSMDSICLRDRDALAAVLEPHRDRIRHLFFGHVHRPVSGSWRGIPFSTVYGTNHQVALDLDPDARLIPGSHEPPAYAVVLMSGDSVVVHTHSYTTQVARFALQAESGLEPREYALSMRADGTVPAGTTV